MASISPLSYSTRAPAQVPVAAAAQTSSATGAATATDTTTYVTNADGSISVTTTNAQGAIVELSTIPAPIVTSASGAAASTGIGGRTPGALLNLIA